jgi:hypothetical protein
LNRAADWEPVIDDEHTSEWLARRDALVGPTRKRCAVASGECGYFALPRENLRILGTGESNILNPNDIEVHSSQQQAAHDVAVEIIVR